MTDDVTSDELVADAPGRRRRRGLCDTVRDGSDVAQDAARSIELATSALECACHSHVSTSPYP